MVGQSMAQGNRTGNVNIAFMLNICKDMANFAEGV